MSSYSSIALVGAGALGSHFVDVLAANESISFIVIARSGSVLSKKFPAGTKVVAADLTNLDSVKAALRDNQVDVVISTLSFTGRQCQPLIADAAKATGVKLFVLSDFGYPSQGAKAPFDAGDRDANYLKSIGLSSVRIFVSHLLDACIRSF